MRTTWFCLALMYGGLALRAGGQARAHPQCVVPQLDTTAWRTLKSEELSAQWRYPVPYVVKNWSNHSPGMPKHVEIWLDDHPGNSVDISFPFYNVEDLIIKPGSIVTRCYLLTRAGEADVMLQSTWKWAGPVEKISEFTINARIHVLRDSTYLSFTAGALDLVEQQRQLVMLSTLAPTPRVPIPLR